MTGVPRIGSADADLLRCRVEKAGSALVLRPVGQLTSANAGNLRDVALKCLAEQPAGLVLDLVGLRADTTVPMTIFLVIARHAAGWPGCPLVLCRADADVATRLRALAPTMFATIHTGLGGAIQEAIRPRPTDTIRAVYRPHPGSIRQARESVTTACTEWGLSPEFGERVQLVTQELITNAVRHARTELDLSLRLSGRFLHVAVADRSPRPARPAGPPESDAPGGRGLILVEEMSISWGVVPTSTGKVMWATLADGPDPDAD